MFDEGVNPEIAWEPDIDLLRDLLLERELDREIERQAAPSTAKFQPVFAGPCEEDFIGFIQQHEHGFAAFDGNKILLDVLKDPNAACNAILFDCLGTRPRVAADTTSKVIQLADLAQETIEITELEPVDGKFIGKQIGPDGYITDYSMAFYWWHRVARVPATIPHLFAHLCEARKRNICLIRGAPVDPEQQPTLRRNVNFNDTPTRLIPLDIDGVKISWQTNPEQAIRTVVAMFGEPWASTSFVWSFSAKHGLEIEKQNSETPETPGGQKPKKRKRWTGRIVDGEMRLHFIFIAERGLDQAEAVALTESVRGRVPAVDKASCRRVQVNYIRRPLWAEHPDRDPLGDIPTIGWIKGTHDILTIPEDLTHTAYMAKAEGRGGDVAVHPDAESAIRGVGSDGSLRSHLRAAVEHLLRANMPPDGVSFKNHSITIANELQNRVEATYEEICGNLASHNRHWSEVLGHISEMALYAVWCLEHPGILRAKTIRLVKEEQAKVNPTTTCEEIFARVERTIERALQEASTNDIMAKRADLEKQLADLKTPAANLQQRMANMRVRASLRKQLADLKPPVILLVAPPGSRKSTLLRDAAVRYVTGHPGKTVVILVPLHKLGVEQIEMLREEHPTARFTAAIWRGRHPDDPLTPDPQHPGKFLMRMCRRAEDVTLAEDVMVDPDHLCMRGRGEKKVKCPFYDEDCAFQKQNRIKEVNIWFAAHECAGHEMPKIFGDVGWVIIDENPLDAFMFGVDRNDPVTIGLDTLRQPLQVADEAKLGAGGYRDLMEAREELYHALDKIHLSDNPFQGAPVLRESLKPFVETTIGYFIETKNPIITLEGEFTEEAPNLDAIRDKYFKIDPKPFIDASNDATLTDLDDDLKPFFKAKYNPNLFLDATYGHMIQSPDFFDMHKLTLRGKFNPEIRPDMSTEQLKIKLAEAAGNTAIKLEAKLWELIEAAGNDKLYGRIQIQRGNKGRDIRMVGLNELKTGWNVSTLICDATADAKLLKPIWPQLEEPEPHGWEQLPRPSSVRVFQCVDRPFSKQAVEVEGQDPKEPNKKTKSANGARRAYAAVLAKALEYGGAKVGVIVYKEAKEEILKNCFVPDWMELIHWGEHLGTNVLQQVRALFVIGRWLAPAEGVVRQTEALFGGYIPEREYVERRKHGRIPIEPDAEGNNTIRVDVWEHAHPMANRVRRQITEGNLIQACERARGGLRGESEPLDLHIWTNVPVPERGPVVPVLWDELAVGLDGLMLATKGVWLRNKADAVRAFKGLFTADGLKSARAGGRLEGAGGVGVFPIGYTIGKTPTPLVQNGNRACRPVFRVLYRRAGGGCKSTEAVFLPGVVDPRGWLEERLGPLAYFEIIEPGEKDEVVRHTAG